MFNRDFHLQKAGHYVTSTARIAPTAEVGHFCVVMGNIAEAAKVNRSFIGQGCTVGPSAVLEEVTLGKNVTIEGDCVLQHCLIGDNCVVYKGTTLKRSILAADVRVGPGVSLEEVRLQSVPFDDGFNDEVDSGKGEESGDSKAACDTARFGAKSVAFEFLEEVDDSDEEDEVNDLIEDQWGANSDGGFSDGFVSEIEEDVESETEDVPDGVDEIDGGQLNQAEFTLTCACLSMSELPLFLNVAFLQSPSKAPKTPICSSVKSWRVFREELKRIYDQRTSSLRLTLQNTLTTSPFLRSSRSPSEHCSHYGQRTRLVLGFHWRFRQPKCE